MITGLKEVLTGVRIDRLEVLQNRIKGIKLKGKILSIVTEFRSKAAKYHLYELEQITLRAFEYEVLAVILLTQAINDYHAVEKLVEYGVNRKAGYKRITEPAQSLNQVSLATTAYDHTQKEHNTRI